MSIAPHCSRRVAAADPVSGDAILLVATDSPQTAAIVEQSVNSGAGVVVLGRTARDVVDYLAAGRRGAIWAVIADPTDPEQIADIIDRAPSRVGTIRMVIDPTGLIPDIAALDQRVA